jgi:hypothetical protein
MHYWLKRIKSWLFGRKSKPSEFKQYPKPIMVSVNRKFRRKVQKDYGIQLKPKVSQQERDVWIWQMSNDALNQNRK